MFLYTSIDKVEIKVTSEKNGASTQHSPHVHCYSDNIIQYMIFLCVPLDIFEPAKYILTVDNKI